MNGGTVGWRNLGLTNFHTSVSSNLDSLGQDNPFSTKATCDSGGNITSIATANLTSGVNGTTLDCSDGVFGPCEYCNTNITSYNLILKGKTMLMKNDLIDHMVGNFGGTK